LNSKLKRSKIVLVIDPRGIIINGGADAINRHIKYGEELNRIDKEFTLIVLSTSNLEFKPINKGSLAEIHKISGPTLNSYKFARLAAKFLAEKKWDIELLVAGDPWESYWSAFLLRRIMQFKIPIQIQLHADIADPKWKRLNFITRARFNLAGLSLSRAEAIRVVSKSQLANLKKSFRINGQKVTIIPIPIKTLDLVLKVQQKKPLSIGFIGRLHQDRGIWEFVELVNKLNSQNKTFKIVIAGSGPDKDEFLNHLYIEVPKSRVSYLGQLPQEKLARLWKQIGVLVSIAPVESYGRVMREALVAGVPVWATESSGVKDLMDICEKGTVKILDLNKSASALNKDFEILLKTKVGPKFGKEFIKENNTYAEKLAQSWVKVISQSKQS